MNLFNKPRWRHLALLMALGALPGCPEGAPEIQVGIQRHGYPNVYPIAANVRPQPKFPQWTSGHALVVYDDLLLVANESGHQVTMLDRASLAVVDAVHLGGVPEQIVVDAHGTVWVALRDTGEVVRFSLSGRIITGRAKLGMRANALALSVDAQRLYALAPIENQLVVLDAASLQELQRVDTAEAPTAVAVGDKDGMSVFVVNHGPQVRVHRRDAAGTVTNGNPRPLRVGTPTDKELFPVRVGRLVANRAIAIAVEPNRGAATILHVQTTPGSPSDLAGVAAGLKLDPDAPTPPPQYYGGADPPDTWNVPTRPIEMLVSEVSNVGIQATARAPVQDPHSGQPLTHVISDPRDIVHHPTHTIALVVGEGSDTLLALSTTASDAMLSPMGYAKVGAMPRAVACSPDGQFAYVLNGHDYTVSEVDLTPLLEAPIVEPKRARGVSISGEKKSFPDPYAGHKQIRPVSLAQGRVASYGIDTTPAAVRRGRRLFHNSRNPDLSRDGHFSCASCHPSGGEDKLVWVVSHGPRQTPALAGRLAGTAPFNWNGTRHDLASNMTRTIGRMGGDGLSADEVADVQAFILEGFEPPPNPNVSSDGLTYQQLWGRQLFNDPVVACATCHTGEATTNNASYDVGTAIYAEIAAYDALAERGEVDSFNPRVFNVPSLRNLHATAPYLHDGSAANLTLMLERTDGLMGKTSHLYEEEREALIAYLKTL